MNEYNADALITADALAERVRREGEAPAIAMLGDALRTLEQEGYPPEAIFGTEKRLGAALKRKDAGTFWSAYADVIRATLCKKDSELQKLSKAGLSGSAGALVPVLLTGLGLPVAAIGAVVPIAAIMAALGVDAFCRWTEPAPGESGGTSKS